jgi:hypothetical protein
MTDLLDKQIGTKEQTRLTAGSVIVKQITIAPPKEGSKAKIVTFHCLHPSREELVKLNNMKVKKIVGNNETITKDGIWYREDDEGNMDKNCNASKVTSFYHKTSLRQFENTSIETELDAMGYLAIKVY